MHVAYAHEFFEGFANVAFDAFGRWAASVGWGKVNFAAVFRDANSAHDSEVHYRKGRNLGVGYLVKALCNCFGTYHVASG